MSHPFDGLNNFSLVDALRGRRSRRFGAGMSIPDGPLAFTSSLEPQALTPEEKGILVWSATGLNGWNLGMPYSATSPGFAANYPLRLAGRTSPSAAGILSSELLIADDHGLWITRVREASPEQVEAVQRATTLQDVVAVTADLTVRVSTEPLNIPAEPGFVPAHNRWDALKPGTTLCVPITDMTEVFLSFLGIYTGEGTVLWDPRTDTAWGDIDELVAEGRLNPSARMPLPGFEQRILQMGTVESGIIAYNGQLMLQAMGLGGWLFAGINAAALLGANAAAGIPGFGFEFVDRGTGVPPHPIGLRGLFETLHPAFAGDAETIVHTFLSRKYGDGGAFAPGDAGPYRDNSRVKAQTYRFDDATVRYLISVVARLIDEFGSFPATAPPVLTTVYLQAQHLDPAFYDTFYDGALLDTHREHQATWH